MWFLLSILLIFLPGHIYRMNKRIIGIFGRFLGNITYFIKSIIPDKKRSSTIKSMNVSNHGHYEDRTFDMWDKNGNLVYPTDDELLGKYISANNNYPSIGSQRYKKARKLDIPYFFSKQYDFDYIVLGDRAQIEETRKGGSLTTIEEDLIVLGYGYDGKPFGYSWGIAERCLNDYLFAEKHGEFLTWGIESGYYEKYVLEGYTPPYQYDSNINNSIQALAYRHLKKYMKPGFESIDKKTLEDFDSDDVKSVLREKYQSINLEDYQDSVIKLDKKTSTH